MGNITNEIALIFFSRTEKAETKAKSWVKGHKRTNTQVATSLIFQSSQLIQRSGLPVFHYHEGNQRGKTFGERLANAYQEVFDLGYTAAIAIGNDCPELASINWEHAIEQLYEGNCVLGPSLRGGAYFIGITATAFKKETFSKLSWQTNKTLADLISYCTSETNPVIYLGTLRDINSFHDLLKSAKSAQINIGFKKLLIGLIGGLQKLNCHLPDQFLPKTIFLSLLSGRAPPLNS